MPAIAIVNGPNLNLVGTREPEVYGSQSLDGYLQELAAKYPGVAVQTYQSNVEGELINYMHECRGKVQGIILNAGAYTHTSIAIRDAISAAGKPAIEVHISNIHKREEFRRKSYIAEVSAGQISGFGENSYILALMAAKNILSKR